jgi:hypothetical protein
MTERSGAQSDERVSGTPWHRYCEPNVDPCTDMEAYQTRGQHEDSCIELRQALWRVSNWPILSKRRQGHSGWASFRMGQVFICF